MNRQQLKNYINNFNEYSDTNSEIYIKARYILKSPRRTTDKEMNELITLAKNKNLIN